jgi:hypothetical protein
MAPPLPADQARQRTAVPAVLAFLDDPLLMRTDLPDALSEVKGLYSRCWRQDQWDWFTVWMQLGRPSRRQCRSTSETLGRLRRAILARDSAAVDTATAQLRAAGVAPQLLAWPDGRPAAGGGVGWLYVLSEREHPRRLKVGYTDGPVEERVRAINSATGVLVPYGVRLLWAVHNARAVETVAHRLLADHRIRADREFFDLDHRDAARIIQAHLDATGAEA